MRLPAFGRSSGSGRLPVILIVTAALAVATAVLVWSAWPGKPDRAYALAPQSALPANIRQAPRGVRDAYRFAIANRDILKQIPCYCGCGAEHQSNAECYIKDVRPDGSIVFDPMSFG